MQSAPQIPGAFPATLPPPPNPVVSDPSQLLAVYQNLIGHWTATVAPYAYDLFYALAALEVAVFGWNLWMHYGGDIRQALMMTANKILIIGAFLALLMNGQIWMAAVIAMFVEVGKAAARTQGLSPSMVLLSGFQIFGSLFGQATLHGLLVDLPAALALLLAAFLIFLSFLVISFQFLVTQVQVALAIGMGYFFLGFGGSRWTTNYVERYFAYSIASGSKLMVLYMLIGAANPLVQSWINTANSGGIFRTSSSIEVCWMIMAGSILYAGVVWFSSSLVSQFFGGSPNLSHSDFVSFMAPAVSAGVTAGMIAAGIATGGATSVAATAGMAGGASGGATPGGVTPPQPSAHGTGGGSAGRAAAAMAQAGSSAMGRMPHGGSAGHPPQFNGFGH